MAFSYLVLDNTATPKNGWSMVSSSMVLSCESGTCDVVDSRGSEVLVTLVAGDQDTSRKILDYYQGAVLNFVPTGACTLRISKHQWLTQ